jgi:hypothetical protein
VTNYPPKRALPLSPHSDHLRKEAKARLAGLKGRMPSVRLSDVQLILAREYGFANWGMLQAEVARRSGQGRRLRNAVAAALALRRLKGENDPDGDNPTAFFHTGLAAQAGFIVVALAGVGMVLVSTAPGFARLAQLIQTIL